MEHESSNAAPKVHPASREVLPEDPMNLHAFEVPGDPELMMRLLVEDYARIGWNTESIMSLACDPNYQVFHGLLKMFGEDELRRRVQQILARTGVMRVTTKEAEAPPEQLIEIDLPTAN